ncbi:MAG TPA: DUF2273 domain-containing protein [Candidatus Goldiibacteriota bacterium]|nr:DUF2273 domain-containing protein [Candidatus Goldiibacteriota bacterium]HPI02483.1 DUF2273 domain-containing protein [Candidatus Goldiibacteriota bacterium]HPN63956.1 DUF2273 domain-containing protein [Candidatus Goldiibacteriota bacterium]HRQ43971.1 DUF2273 domain-containing protein [Candidatus Goldiibacteriota bacterium]
MTELVKLILLNIGRITGVIAGFVLALFLVVFGVWKTVFIIFLTAFGFILGRFYDDGFDIKKTFREILSVLRMDKWHS